MIGHALKTAVNRGAIALLIGVCALTHATAHADWELLSEGSQLNFISIKATHIAEQHGFESITGSVKDNGDTRLTIDLASVATNIDIRNQRMRDMLFNVAEFPTASFSANVDTSAATALAIGEQMSIPVSGQLQLKRMTVDVDTVVTAVRLADNKIMLSNQQPLLLNAGQLGLEQGVEMLRAVAKLPSISLAVPVTFRLLFQKQS